MDKRAEKSPERKERSGLVSQIRVAEAQLKALNHQLEAKTGVTEEEGMLLDVLNKMEWTDHVELADLKIGWGMSRNSRVVSTLKQKRYIDHSKHGDGGPIRFRINHFGREALTRFKKELKP